MTDTEPMDQYDATDPAKERLIVITKELQSIANGLRTAAPLSLDELELVESRLELTLGLLTHG